MFKTLVNEAKLTFALKTVTPLLINSGKDNKIRPSYDMSPMTAFHNGIETVYIPGSTAKGVFRSRYEQLMTAVGEKNICNIVDRNNRCSRQDKKTALEIYRDNCAACKLFGNLSLGSRIHFADAFPVGEVKKGYRHGVGIDRITGAARSGAKFEYEMVEEGAFGVTITLQNFALYQLRLILWILEDINEGLLYFGMGGTRGNGRMATDGAVKLEYRHMDAHTRKLCGYFPTDSGGEIEPDAGNCLFGMKCTIEEMDKLLAALKIADLAALKSAIQAEERELTNANSASHKSAKGGS